MTAKQHEVRNMRFWTSLWALLNCSFCDWAVYWGIAFLFEASICCIAIGGIGIILWRTGRDLAREFFHQCLYIQYCLLKQDYMSNPPCLRERNRYYVFWLREYRLQKSITRGKNIFKNIIARSNDIYISEYMIHIQNFGVRKHGMVFNGSTHWDVLAAVEINLDYLCQLVFVCLLKKTQKWKQEEKFLITDVY